MPGFLPQYCLGFRSARQQKACVKEIIEHEYTVQQFSDVLRFNTHIDFGDLPVRLHYRSAGAAHRPRWIAPNSLLRGPAATTCSKRG
jgi:hypothetical protein